MGHIEDNDVTEPDNDAERKYTLEYQIGRSDGQQRVLLERLQTINEKHNVKAKQ